MIQTIRNYIEVLKPRESPLLALFAILVTNAGANGITNYLDHKFDARMKRTSHWILPSRRIYPPERALPFTKGMIIVGLVLAWFLHPLAFAADLIGTLVALQVFKLSLSGAYISDHVS